MPPSGFPEAFRALVSILLVLTSALGTGGVGDHAGQPGGPGRPPAGPAPAPTPRPTPGAEPVVTRPLSDATRAWWDYERAATFEVATTQVDVPMRDGTSLGCDLHRPAEGATPVPGRHPGLVVELTPYALLVPSWNREASFFAERGYNGLVCTVRGVGRSGGGWQHAMSSQDGRDAHDLVEWLADQPWSDGRIGQFGESYGGQTTYGAAVEQAPSLRAIAPMQSPGNLYDDVIYPGGIKATEGGTIDNWPGIAEGLSGGAVDAADEYATNRAHPTFDDYWQERSIADRVDDVEVPVLAIGGWEDGFFRSGTLTDIEGALDRTWAIYGQWPHRTPVALGECTGCVPDPLPSGVLLAWFDHWVMELPDVPVPDEPVFISEEGPAGEGEDDGWRELSHWDPEGRAATTFSLGADGTLAPGRGARAHAAGGGDDVTIRQPAEPTDGGGSATFTSPPLGADQVLLGWPELDLRATLSAGDANLYVELLDVAPDGTETVVNDGFLRASHRRSHEHPEPVTPGEALELEIRVRADHHRFAAGHRVGLRVSGGSSDTLVPVEEPVEVTLHPDGSTLRLPRPVPAR